MLQALPIVNAQPINFAATFSALDFNVDGYLDFSITTEIAMKWGTYSAWIYDPRSERFVENELTKQLHDLGVPNAGMDIDPAKHEISYHSLPVTGACFEGTDHWRETFRYRIDNDRLTLIHQEKLTWDGPNCTMTVSDLIGGAIVVTSVRSKPGDR